MNDPQLSSEKSPVLTESNRLNFLAQKESLSPSANMTSTQNILGNETARSGTKHKHVSSHKSLANSDLASVSQENETFCLNAPTRVKPKSAISRVTNKNKDSSLRNLKSVTGTINSAGNYSEDQSANYNLKLQSNPSSLPKMDEIETCKRIP